MVLINLSVANRSRKIRTEKCGGFHVLRLFSDRLKFTLNTENSKGEMTQREKKMKYYLSLPNAD